MIDEAEQLVGTKKRRLTFTEVRKQNWEKEDLFKTFFRNEITTTGIEYAWLVSFVFVVVFAVG